MKRAVLPACWIVAALLAAPALSQTPDELLDKAVSERQEAKAASSADPKAADALISEADRLARQKKFDEAITLYEKAYRLDPGDRNSYAKLLVARKAAGRMTESDSEALDLIEEDLHARIDDTIRSVRLVIVQAREAVRTGDSDLAKTRVEHGRTLLDKLPDDVNVSIYRRELDSIAVAAQKKARRQKADESVRMSDMGTQESGDAAKADESREPQQSYEPDGRIVEYAPPIGSDDQLDKYQRDLDRAVRASRARMYFDAQAAQIRPCDDMTFPPDWPERTARRARFEGGEIYRSSSFTGPDGQEYYTSVYNLGDLVHPVPNFYASRQADPAQRLISLLDRQALQQRSQIFGGYAEDLAAGLPLLQYFGGIDEWAVSPRSDPYELERVLTIIDEFVTRQNAGAAQPQADK